MFQAPQGAKPTAAATKARTLRRIIEDMRADRVALGQSSDATLLAIVGLSLDDSALSHLYDAVIAAERHRA